MTRIAVDLGRLGDLVDRMAAFERQLVGTHDDVAARIAQLHSSWTGEAAEAQAAAQHEWTAALTEVHRALGALRRAGATSHANYAAAIAANRRMWAR